MKSNPSIPFNDLKPQYSSIRDEIQEAVQRVLEGGWYILGAEGRAFEAEFAAYCGARYAVGLGSGTEALHLGLRALGVKPGDEVITVANAGVPTVAAVCMAGARPVLVDVDPLTHTLDPAQVEARVTSRTRAIVPVHLYGHPADLDPLLEVARRHSLRVLEDAAQAHGAEYKGRRVGALADAAAFSFYPTKNLGAYGDGGLVATDDEEVAERIRLLRTYGWARRYESAIQGFNSRLDELQAAVLRVKLRHLDAWNLARRELAALYDRRLQGVEGLTLPQESAWARHVYHLYVVRTPHRDGLQQYLQARGVGTSVHYPVPVHLQEAYRELGLTAGALPASERAAREVLSLPLYPELGREGVEVVAGLIKEFAAKDLSSAQR